MKIALVLFLCFGSVAHAETVISCNDADTCKFQRKNSIVKVRFSGIDAPESDQPLGKEARDFLMKQISGKTVTLKCNGKSYGRETCSVFVKDTDIQRELVRNGWALDYPKYSTGKYKPDEDYAKKNKLGMWKRDDIYSPYCWRWMGTSECTKNRMFQE